MPLLDQRHDLIVGECNPEKARELCMEIMELGEGQSPRQYLLAASMAMGLVIGNSFSKEMHDGCYAACLDIMAAWARKHDV